MRRTIAVATARWIDWLHLSLVFVWPFVFFHRRVWPIGGLFSAIGNDFEPWHYRPKAFLLDQLVHGRIPLWAPSEAIGFPFYCNPHVQAFYPLNVVALVYKAFAGGYTLLDHQRFTILACAIFALGLYLWLRMVGLDRRASFVAAIIMPVSFKLGEILRFTSAVHTAAWYPWVLLALTALFKVAGRRDKAKAGFGLFVACVFLVTAGYTYYLYYGVFLFVPYVALLLWPSTARDVMGRPSDRPLESVLVAAASVAAAAVVCSPLLLKVAELVSQAPRRTGANLRYSTAYTYTPGDSLGALFFPPTASSTEGWLYFGGVGILLAIAGLALGRLAIVTRCLVVAWICGILALTWGTQSALFMIFWKHFPGFDRLRAWPRLSIVLVPVLAWLLGQRIHRHRIAVHLPTATSGGAAPSPSRCPRGRHARRRDPDHRMEFPRLFGLLELAA